MADTFVFGLVSLLLAAAGAVYLLWVRVLRPGGAKAAPRWGTKDDRASDTVPPVLLRSEAELSPKMLAKREALGKRSSRPPPPAEDLEASGVASRDRVEPAGAMSKRERPKSLAVDAGKATANAAAAKAEPAKSSDPASAKRAVGGSSDPASAKVTAPASPRAKADATVASSKETKEAPAPKTTIDDAFANIPRIDAEEDEEVEPTRVGRFVKPEVIQPVVEKIVFDPGAAEPALSAPPTSLLVVYALAQTDTGKRRKQNEDSLLVSERDGVFVVADGMGGHRGGQHASRLAVKTIGEAFESKTFEAAHHEDIPLEASELARAMQMANTAIFHEAKLRPELTGMGTTLCALRFTEDKQRLYLGHVGDSRCYRLRDGVMKQMTADHTMADYGVTGPEGAHLSRAIGVWPTVPIDVIMAEPKLGDVYLLCSDGLTKMVPDTTIATQLLHEEDPKAAVERLVFFANAAGGKDNITVILLRVVEPDWKPPSAAP